MNKIAEQKNKRRFLLKREKSRSYITVILYVFGFIAILPAQRQFNFTLVNPWVPLLVGIAAGIIASIILNVKFKHYLFSIVAFGYFFVSILFFINNYTNAPTNNLTEKIVSISGNRWPSVTIYYNGFYKDISIDQEGKAHAKRS